MGFYTLDLKLYYRKLYHRQACTKPCYNSLMKALYRKYRPTKLSQVIGEEQVVKPLENALKQGKISHAYLFTGPRGCGKTSVARIFAHEINKFPYEIEDNYVDIIEIDAASNTGVDNIRDLREKAVIAPTKGRYKVYIIDEVHMLTKAAFNALLKTLEEPPKSVVFIMATTDAYKVPVTIISRSQVYNFHLADINIMQKHLAKIAKNEKINIEDSALTIIAEKGGGSFRDSISLLDQISTLSDQKITKKTVLEALGLPDQILIRKLLDAYKSQDFNAITDALQSELDSGIKPEILAEGLIQHIIKSPEPELLPLLEKLPEVKSPFPEAKLLLAFLGAFSKTSTKPAPNPINIETSPAKTSSDINDINATSVQNQTDATNQPEIPPQPESTALQPEEASSRPETITPQPESQTFDRTTFLDNIKTKNAAIASILEKSRIEKQGNTIHIIPEHKTHLIILRSINNQKIIQAALGTSLNIELHDADEIIQKSTTLTKISDIMGTVTEVNASGDPF